MLDASIDTAENFNLEDTLGKERQNFKIVFFRIFVSPKQFFAFFHTPWTME